MNINLVMNNVPFSISGPVSLLAIGIGMAIFALILLLGFAIFNFFDMRSGKNKSFLSKALINTSVPTLAAILGMAAFFLIGGTWLFKNPVPAILAGTTIVLIPYQLAYRKRRASQIGMLNELATVVRSFADYYEQSGQLMAAMDFVGKNIPTQAGKQIKNAYSRLIYGVDPNKVLDNLAYGIDLEYGYVFVDLLRQARLQGAVTTQLFYSLADRITDEQELMNESIQETLYIKTFNLIMAMMPLPAFLILQNIVPGVGEWLTQSLAGRMIVSGCFLSVIAWFFIERVVDEF